ncbi:MAG: hypothetical protein H7242_17420, partial [Microbacteriaceae bacterium]|nr:hypothetical protein [Burkholderiaceae bacterium]
LAWASRDAAGALQVDSLLQRFDGDRAAVRQATVVVALQGLLARAQALPGAAR